MSKRLTIITPVFNEAAGLTEFLQHLDAVAATIESEFPVRVDYVFIDDGSADATFEMLRAQHFTRPAQVLRLSRNFGKEAALSAGVDAAAGADAAVLIDADLQHPPAMIQDFVRIEMKLQLHDGLGVRTVHSWKKSLI